MASALRSEHHIKTEHRLMKDPIVQQMARELSDEAISVLTHDDGTPTFGFMQIANEQYAMRCEILGKEIDSYHIGAIANAILMFRKQYSDIVSRDQLINRLHAAFETNLPNLSLPKPEIIASMTDEQLKEIVRMVEGIANAEQ